MIRKNRFDGVELPRPSSGAVPRGVAGTVGDLFDTWEDVRGRNRRLTAYYEMRNGVKDFGISIPPQLRHVDEVVGWAARAVDVRVNRSRFDGFVFEGQPNRALDALCLGNGLAQLVREATRSMLTHGCAAMTVMRGGAGQPAARVRAYSANQCCMLWDKDAGGIGAGVTLTGVDRRGMASRYVVHLPDRVLVLSRPDPDSPEFVLESDEPNPVGSILMVPLINDPDLDKPLGHAVLTPELTSIIDKAVRDVLRMDVGAEFFTAPQRYALGVADDLFASPMTGEDGSVVTDPETGEPVLVTDEAKKLRAYLGAVWAITRDENGDVPQVGQFPAGSAENFIATYENDAQRFSGASLVPLAQLGVLSNNYTSSDALSASNDPLILDVQAINDGLRGPLRQVARLMMAISQGKPLSGLSDAEEAVQARFAEPAMQTFGARVDGWTKLAAMDGSIVGTRVLWEGVGLDRATIDRLMAETSRTDSITLLEQVRESMGEAQAASKANAQQVVATSVSQMPSSGEAE